MEDMKVFRSSGSFFAVLLLLLQCTAFTWSKVPTLKMCQKDYIDKGDCDFYSKCVEKRVPCGQNGYALSYGNKYCRKFGLLSKNFDKNGQQWIADVRKCLMEEITKTDAYKNLDPSECDELERHAFESHSDCYIEHGFCSTILLNTNLKQLLKAIEIRDLFTLSSLEEVVQTMFHCVNAARKRISKWKWKDLVADLEKIETFICDIIECVTGYLKRKLEELKHSIRDVIRPWVPELLRPFLGLLASNGKEQDFSVVFVLDASGSIGVTEFFTQRLFVQIVAMDFAVNGIGVGIVRVSGNVSVVTPLQVWENDTQLWNSITDIDYAEGSSPTHEGISIAASLLGSEGTRNLILFPAGITDSQGTVNATIAAKEAGINVYVVGIGESVSEEEVYSLASYPPEEYGVSISDYNALEDILQPLIVSTYLTPQQLSVGEQYSGMLEEGQVFSFQYVLPADGLTVSVVTEGEANLYASYTTHSPTFLTADFVTGGSGILSFYIPQAVEGISSGSGILPFHIPQAVEGIVYISLITPTAQGANFTLGSTYGDMTNSIEPGAPEDFYIASLASREVSFIWYRPHLTNGVLLEYTLLCASENATFSDAMEVIEVAMYQTNLQQFATIRGLHPGVMYSCSVSASNEVGYGPASIALIETLEEDPTTPGR